MEPKDLSEFEQEQDSATSEGGIILLPKELEEAPEDVKEFYVKWLEVGKLIENDKERYFSFVSTKNGQDCMVDAMNWAGRAIKLAKEKGISEGDLARLTDLSKAMEMRKVQKSRLKVKWMKYVRPRMGRDVYDWQKSNIIEQYSRYANHDEVKKELEKLGYSVNMGYLMKFFLNNKDIIDKKRLEFIRSSRDHYLATDAGRMETLAMLHAKFVQMFNDGYATSKPDKNMLRALSQEIRAIVEQARKEIKGEEVKLTIDGKIDINASMQATLTIQEISRKIPINVIPIYMVAVKRGINPNSIIASLVNSFYKDFNGFSKIKGTGQVPNTMDIIRNYDWNEIAQYHRDKPEENDDSIVQYEEIPFHEVSKVQNKRELLLKLIKEQTSENGVDIS
jgi:hypothetical protein